MHTQVKCAPPDDEEMFTTSFRLRRGDWAALQRIAAAEHRTASGQIRYLIERAVDAAGPEKKAA